MGQVQDHLRSPRQRPAPQCHPSRQRPHLFRRRPQPTPGQTPARRRSLRRALQRRRNHLDPQEPSARRRHRRLHHRNPSPPTAPSTSSPPKTPPTSKSNSTKPGSSTNPPTAIPTHARRHTSAPSTKSANHVKSKTPRESRSPIGRSAATAGAPSFKARPGSSIPTAS